MDVILVSVIHVQRLTCEIFDAPERSPFMNIRNAFRGLRVWAGLAVFVLSLCGCAVGVAADIVSVGTTGKTIADHVLDVVTGEDCSLFQGAWRSDRDVCEPRETEVTTHDFKGLSDPGNSPEGRSADPSLAAAPSVIPGSPFGPGPSGDPGGPPSGELY
jgi:hypothetical protein